MNFGRNLALWVVIALLVFALFNLFQGGSSYTRGPHTPLAFSDFLASVESNEVRDVVMQGNTITGKGQLGFALAAWMIIIMAVSMTGYLLLRRRAERWRRA